MALSRITERLTQETFLQQLTQARQNVEISRAQIASGVEVALPSDDPGNAGIILQLRTTSERLQTHKDRVALATGLLSIQEETISSANDIMVRARELATQAANSSIPPSVRNQMADEVFALRDSLVSLGNTKFDGRFIYGAAEDDDAPFVAVTYDNPPSGPESERYVYDHDNTDGGETTRTIAISDTETIRVNSAGSQVFSGAIASIERLGRALKGFETTIDGTTGLPDGTGNQITLPDDVETQLTEIRSALDAIESTRTTDIISEQSSVGTRLAQLNRANDELEGLLLNTEQTRAALQDVDIFEAASRFTGLQTSLEALLNAGARIGQLTLLNYL